MAGFPQPDPTQNLKEILFDAVRTSIRYGQVRTQLFALEAREAATTLSQRAAFSITGGFLVFIGYVLALVCLIRWLSDRLSVSWELIGICAAGVHLLAGMILLLIAKGLAKAPVFEATLNELEREREWITEDTGTPPKKRS